MNLTTFDSKDSSLNFFHEKDILKTYNKQKYNLIITQKNKLK